MSFSKGLRVERSQRGHVDAKHTRVGSRSGAPWSNIGSTTRRSLFRRSNANWTDWKKAIEALKNLYQHRHRRR